MLPDMFFLGFRVIRIGMLRKIEIDTTVARLYCSSFFIFAKIFCHLVVEFTEV